MNKRREQAIVAALLRFEKQTANDAGGFILNRKNKEHALIFDLNKTPHAFVIGCVLDQQITAEKAWAGPHKLAQRIGDFSFDRLRQLKQNGWKKYLGPQKRDPEIIHRYWETRMPKYLESAMQAIDWYSDGRGDARRMWTGAGLRGDDIVNRFKSILGVGDKIANMAVRILVTRFKQPIKKNSIDVSVDVHVAKVFPRLGLVQVDESTSQRDIKKIIVQKARELHPSFPAKIDRPIFIIGKNFCHKTNPNCGDCPMKRLCDHAKASRK